MKRHVLVSCLLIAFTGLLFAEYNSMGLPDSSDIRKDLIETWFEAPVESLRENIPEIRANKAGQKFKVSMEEDDEYAYVYVASGKSMNVNVFSEKGMVKEQQIVYPGNLPGTWVLVKEKSTNKIIRIRYFFAGDDSVYVQFSPYGKIAIGDMVIFGQYAAKGVSTGVPFSSFYTASFDDVMILTQKSLPWKYVQINPSYYHGVQSMLTKIQENLPRIFMLDNAMYDENNELVNITDGKTLNPVSPTPNMLYLSSAGCAKWVADGLVYPVTGGQLKRGPLITPTVEVKNNGVQGVRSQTNSLYFTLDWVRNLTSAVISVYSGKKYVYPDSGVDVTINPFASAVSASGEISNQIGYIKDTGYSTSMLKSLLYVLAATEPDAIYVGAIRETDRTIKPELKVFNKCAVFFPYFKSNGTFECKVFMDGRILSLTDFCLIYSSDYVYLTRMRSSENFDPK